jgi:hypothetical protein
VELDPAEMAERYGSRTVLDWRDRLVCSQITLGTRADGRSSTFRQRGRATEFKLLPSRGLAELEPALAPLLPTFVEFG